MGHKRMKVSLKSLSEIQDFSKLMNEQEDDFVMENEDGTIQLPGKTMLGILRMAYSTEPYFFVVNKTRDGEFPPILRFKPL